MRASLLLGIAVLVVITAAVGLLHGRPEKDKQKDPQAKKVADLIEQLGDEEFARREAAGKALAALGGEALSALVDAAADSPDAEIRRRARKLVQKLLTREYKSKTTGLEMRVVEPGSFDMGSPAKEMNRHGDEAQHRVRLSRPYYLGTYEVTQQEYQDVMKTDPSWFSAKGGGKGKVKNEKHTDRFPVERVTWFDAVEFCNKLSKADGFAPYYKLTDVKREGGSISEATVSVTGGRGYRLPTEAEWEHACRAGTTTAFHFGRDAKAGDLNAKSIMVAIAYGSAPKWKDLDRTAEVGSSKPNAWGFYDMHGNVMEWCADRYDKDYYNSSPATDPRGPDKGKYRALRGGSWLVTEGSCRSASRAALLPDERKSHAGFRVARNP